MNLGLHCKSFSTYKYLKNFAIQFLKKSITKYSRTSVVWYWKLVFFLFDKRVERNLDLLMKALIVSVLRYSKCFSPLHVLLRVCDYINHIRLIGKKCIGNMLSSSTFCPLSIHRRSSESLGLSHS